MGAEEVNTLDEESDAPFRPGVQIGSYKVERVIGEGGMGAVYYARHVGLDKPVAIKALHAELAANKTAVARFLREGRALSKIRHPHVVDVTDVGTYEQIPYLVMEYLEGEDLEARLERHGPFVPSDIARIMLPVLDALATAHEAGVVHRDLKPSNIFLAKGPRGREVSMVLDFGIAKIIDQPKLDGGTLTRAASFLGTPYYSSPEQARSVKSVDARADQYSLGAIIYELSSGQTSVAGGSPFEVLVSIVANKVRPIRTVQPDVDPTLEALVHRALAFTPEDRYADLRELGRAMLELATPQVRGEWKRAFTLESATIKGNPWVRSDSDGKAVDTRAFAPTVVAHAQEAGLGRVDVETSNDMEPDTIQDQPREAFAIEAANDTVDEAELTLGGFRVRREHLMMGAMIGVVGALAFAVLLALVAIAINSSEAEIVRIAVEPGSAEVEVDGEPVGAGAFELTRDDEVHRVRIDAPGFEPYEHAFDADETPPSSIELTPSPPSNTLQIGGGIEHPTAEEPSLDEPDPEAPTDEEGPGNPPGAQPAPRSPVAEEPTAPTAPAGRPSALRPRPRPLPRRVLRQIRQRRR